MWNKYVICVHVYLPRLLLRVKRNLILLTKGKVGNETYKNEKTYNKNRQKMKTVRKWGYTVFTPIKFYRPTL